MKKIFLFLLSLGFLASVASAQNVFYFGQVGDGRAGSIIFQTSAIFVNTGNDTTIKVEFFTSDLSHEVSGRPMEIELGSLGTKSSFDIPLKKGEAFSVQTPGTGGLKVGYAKVTAPASVGGTAVFTRKDATSGVTLYEAGVPASPTLTNFSFFLDSLRDKDTGLALVNTAASSANLRLRLYNKAFGNIATTEIPLAPGAHLPRFINQFFTAVAEATEMEGSVTVESDKPLAAVTLRQNDSGLPFPQTVPALTAFPVVSGRADSAAAGSFSVISTGDVLVAVDTSRERTKVLGVLYRIYEGDKVIREVVRGFDSEGPVTDVLALPRSGGRKPLVSRAEAQFIYAGGQLGSSFELRP